MAVAFLQLLVKDVDEIQPREFHKMFGLLSEVWLNRSQETSSGDTAFRCLCVCVKRESFETTLGFVNPCCVLTWLDGPKGLELSCLVWILEGRPGTLLWFWNI